MNLGLHRIPITSKLCTSLHDHFYISLEACPANHFDDYDSRNRAVGDAVKLDITEEELFELIGTLQTNAMPSHIIKSLTYSGFELTGSGGIDTDHSGEVQLLR